MNALKSFVQLCIFKVLVLKKYANKFCTLKQNFCAMWKSPKQLCPLQN